jgi:hypothetical protein
MIHSFLQGDDPDDAGLEIARLLCAKGNHAREIAALEATSEVKVKVTTRKQTRSFRLKPSVFHEMGDLDSRNKPIMWCLQELIKVQTEDEVSAKRLSMELPNQVCVYTLRLVGVRIHYSIMCVAFWLSMYTWIFAILHRDNVGHSENESFKDFE